MINMDRLRNEINTTRDLIVGACSDGDNCTSYDVRLADDLVLLANCIDDLNERITRIEKDLDATGMPRFSLLSDDERDLDAAKIPQAKTP